MNEVLSSAPAAASTGEHAPVASGKIAVLLVNLGTPEAAGAGAVRRYLKEFLTDLRVIEDQGPLWQLVLNGIVLPIRPRKKARDYAKIWNHERNESPLKTITRSQAEKLARALGPLGKHLVVDWAMRYGSPSIASRLGVLVAQGCERILDRGGTLPARLQARGRPRLLPRRAEGLRGQWRPLLCPLCRDHAAPARAAQSRRDEIGDDVSVAVRPRQMARARNQSHHQEACQRGGQESCGDHAGLLGRLSGNTRGDRHRERASLQEIRRREFCGHTLPQRQCARHAGDLADDATGAQGLGVKAEYRDTGWVRAGAE